MKLKKFFYTLTFKLYGFILLIILTTSLLIGYTIYHGKKELLIQEFKRKGFYLTKLLSEEMVEPLLYEEKLTLYNLLERAIESDPELIIFGEVYNLQGEPVISISKTQAHKLLSFSDLKNIDQIIVKEYPTYYEFITPILAKNFGPVGYLRLGMSHQGLTSHLEDLKKRAFLTTFLIAFGAIFIAWLIVYKIVRPAQESLLRAEKLSALGTFAAGLAHEIKNPLTSIKLLLQGSLANDLPLEKEDLKIMEKEIARIDKIVRDFLHFARSHPKRRIFFDLRETIKEVENLCRKEFELSSLEFKVFFPEEPLNFYGDPDGIKQVLINLLLNAYQALNGKGGRIELKAEKNEKAIIISVIDNGPGIPPEILPRIFDPFFTTKPEGTGMGLAIVNSIVKEHEGMVEVESNAKGTKVSVILPLRERP